MGLGTMGAGIAEVFARAGYAVVGVEADERGLARGRSIIEASTAKAVEKGKLADAERTALLNRLDLGAGVERLAHCDIVVEAAFENLDVKRDLFARIADIVPAEAVLATNTSSMSVTAIAMATPRPAQVIGVHFFNPAPVQPLVEIVTTLHTAPSVTAGVEALVARLGKTCYTVTDRAGFVVNALLMPYLNRAITLLQDGVADRDSIDAAMGAAGMPMGPLALGDLIGLDVGLAVSQRLYDETKDPLHAPPSLLISMVTAGLLGAKTGEGFYPHRGQGERQLVPKPTHPRPDDLPLTLLAPYLNDCLRMVQTGYADRAAVNAGMHLGCRMPEPFAQLDELGAATVLAALERVHDESGQPGHKPCRLLRELAADDEPTVAD